MTQRQLADRVGVAINTISRGENGHGRWYPNTARRIFDALNSAAPLQASESQALLRALDLTATLARPGRSASVPAARYSILPADIEGLVSQLIYVAGPGPVLEFLRAAQALMSASDEVHPVVASPPAAVPPRAGHPPSITGAVAIESRDPETGAAVRKYIPAGGPTAAPERASRSRRRAGG